MKFRYHKGGFHESMKTTIEVNSLEELLNDMNKKYDSNMTELKFRYCTFDNRNNWDTWIVTGKVLNDGILYSIGYSDGELIK